MPTERKTLADRRPLDIGKAHYELLSELKADLARQGIKSTRTKVTRHSIEIYDRLVMDALKSGEYEFIHEDEIYEFILDRLQRTMRLRSVDS